MDGGGAYRYGARWNSPGRRAIYAAESYAGCLLEVLVHANTGRLPIDLVWTRISIPRSARIQQFTETGRAWNAGDYLVSREAGDRWLEANDSLVLVVSSIVTAGIERNVVINPDHEQFQSLTVTKPEPVIWDERLFTFKNEGRHKSGNR